MFRSTLPFLACLGLFACHESTPSPPPGPAPIATSLGLSFSNLFGQGDHWFATVSEAAQGLDLDGDGGLTDAVIHRLDLEAGTASNTGLVLATTGGFGDFASLPQLELADGIAFAVSEANSGEVDLNADGDTLDGVLHVVSPVDGSIRNLGFAVTRLFASGGAVAFDALEGAEDLDGNGVIDPDVRVPHLFEFASGETRAFAVSGAAMVGLDAAYVALVEFELLVGDRNGDGDTADLVLAFLDRESGVLQSTGLTLPSPILFHGKLGSHRGIWAFHLFETDPNLGDANGDGDFADAHPVVFDPRSGASRAFVGLQLFPMPEVEPLVLIEARTDTVRVWLYDTATDALEVLPFVCVGVQPFESRLALTVSESDQRQDLDGDGEFSSWVPILYDPLTEEVQNPGVAGHTFGGQGRLLIYAREDAPTDWNQDGDSDDTVPHVWDPRTQRLHNTRIAANQALLFGERSLALLLSEAEAGEDGNGDGDLLDEVAHVYDISSRRLFNLGLASFFLLFRGELGGERTILSVSEVDNGLDSNGDGDLEDRVLYRVER